MRLIPFLFAGGINTELDAKMHSPREGELLDIKDGVFDGPIGVKCRSGSTTLSGVIPDRFVTTFRDAPVCLEHNLWTHNSSLTVASGDFHLVPVNLTVFNTEPTVIVNDSDKIAYYPELAVSGHIVALIYVARDNDDSEYTARLTTYNLHNKQIYQTITLPLSGSGVSGNRPNVKVVSSDTGTIYYFFIHPADRTIWYGTINSTNGAINPPEQIAGVTVHHVYMHLDATACTTGADRVCLVYPNNTADLGIAFFEGGTVLRAITYNLTGSVKALGCWKTKDNEVGVLYHDSDTSYERVNFLATDFLTSVNNATAASLGPHIVWSTDTGDLSLGDIIHGLTGIPITDATSKLYLTRSSEAFSGLRVEKCSSFTNATGAYNPVVIAYYNARLASKGWKDSTGKYFYLVHAQGRSLDLTTVTQRSYYIIEDPDTIYDRGRPVGKVLPDYAGGVNDLGYTPSNSGYHLSNVVQVTKDHWLTAVIRNSLKEEHLISSASPAEVKMLRDLHFLHPVEAENLLIPGSLPYEFDGTALFEQGFLQFPDDLQSNIGVVASGELEAGKYGYAAVYEQYDANNSLHQSAPSPIHEVSVLQSGVAVNVFVPSLRHTLRDSVAVALYRSTSITENGNDVDLTTGAGTNFYFVARKPNDPTAATIIIEDLNHSNSITDNPLIYTLGAAGQEQENVQPQPYEVSCYFQGRVFYVDAEHAETHVYYSKELTTGYSTRWQSANVINVPPQGGKIVALVPHYDNLLILKEDAIYATSGEGFTSTLGGANYPAPRLLSSNVGCSNPNSVVKVPIKGGDSVVFQSRDGLYIISAGSALVPFRKANYWISNDEWITSANVLPDQNNLIITTSGESGRAICYNYLYDKWSSFSNWQATDATVADSRLYFRDNAYQRIRRDDPTVGYDTLPVGSGLLHSGIMFQITTGFVHPAGPAGYATLYRTYLLGQNINPQQIDVKTGYDLEPAFYDDEVYASNNLQSFDVSKYLDASVDTSFLDQGPMLECSGSRTLLSAVRHRITCVPSGVLRDSGSILGLVYEVDGSPGGNRLGPAKRTSR